MLASDRGRHSKAALTQHSCGHVRFMSLSLVHIFVRDISLYPSVWNEALPPQNNLCTALTRCQPRSASCQRSQRLCRPYTCRTHGSIACPTASSPQSAMKRETCFTCVAVVAEAFPLGEYPSNALRELLEGRDSVSLARQRGKRCTYCMSRPHPLTA
jgi:hypothetical protein